MKHISYLVILTLLIQLSACKKCDYSIPTNTRTLFSFYQPGDTLFFSTRTGTDTDTLVIQSIDSSEFCRDNGLFCPKGKTLGINIKMLPNNGLNGSIQHLFFMSKINHGSTEPTFNFWIGYQNFSEPFYLDSISTGERLTDLGISEYWNLPNNWYDPKQTPNDVMEILWTREYGLTEYSKLNGDTLRINMP